MINYKELTNQLDRNKLENNSFLLISKDYYKILKVISKLKRLISSELNFTSVNANEIENINDVISNCKTYPLFDKYRIVIINNIDFKKHKGIIYDMCKYIPKLPRETILVFTHYIIDKRENYKKNATVKKFEKNSTVVYSDKIAFDELRTIAVEEKIKLDNGILNLLMDADNLDVARNDIMKLSAIDNLSVNNVKQYLSPSSEIDVFNLTEAIKDNNLEKALNHISNLKEKGENDIVINIMLMNTFKLLYDCKIFKEIMNEDAIAQRLKMHPYPVKLACNQCKNFSEETLKKAINLCLDFDISIKKGMYSSLDILVLKILA